MSMLRRLPVRIVVDRSPTGAGLRPGLLVELTVDVTGRTGPSFAESGVVGPQLGCRAQEN
ncbi:MAG: HlyD family secretion protein [Caulobacter sp.]|nr:HlyD family secretion protein [Caulobacter sp.]